MRKTLLGLICLLWLSGPAIVKAQSFTVAHDTVYATVITTAAIHNSITNTTSSGLPLRWRVTATSFPTDWLTSAAFGVCDRDLCRPNDGDTLLWRVATNAPGDAFLTSPYFPATPDVFDLSLSLAGASNGSHWVTITINDPGSFYSKNITFVINKVPAAVTNINGSSNDVVLYPNPAREELNVVFNPNADIKTIAVYNIIGKLLTVYKVSGASANLRLESIPSGIYFVRLMNSHGDVVVTRKFTRQ